MTRKLAADELISSSSPEFGSNNGVTNHGRSKGKRRHSRQISDSEQEKKTVTTTTVRSRQHPRREFHMTSLSPLTSSSFRPSSAASSTFHRSSPTSRRSITSSPRVAGEHYAGAKFSGPPLANVLPRPPSHWLAVGA